MIAIVRRTSAQRRGGRTCSAGGHERGGEQAWTEAADRRSLSGGGESVRRHRATSQHNNDNTQGGHDTRSVHGTCETLQTYYYGAMNKIYGFYNTTVDYVERIMFMASLALKRYTGRVSGCTRVTEVVNTPLYSLVVQLLPLDSLHWQILSACPSPSSQSGSTHYLPTRTRLSW